MVNASPTTIDPPTDHDRRRRARAAAAAPASLGLVNPNPFGDLHTLQHLSARLARALKPVFEPLCRGEVRLWAEPLVVQRLADYRAERGDGLAAWLPLPAGYDAPAQLVLGAALVLELLDLFFGGPGHAPATLPAELSPAADAMVARLGRMILPVLTAAWEPVARIEFRTGAVETNPATLTGVEPDDAIVVTRFGLARGVDGKPAFFDIAYPVATLKPHTQSLTGKVHARPADPDPAWRNTLTRAIMGVRFPVRSVLAEPVIPLVRLLALKVGDVIPIGLGDQVPVMIGDDRIAIGTVGTAGGKAAILLNSMALLEGPNQ